MNEIVSPFILKRPNRCLNCDSQLVLVTVTTELQITEIDDEGHPFNIKTDDNHSTTSLYCPICQSRYYAWIDEANMIIRPAYGDSNVIIVDRDPDALHNSPFNSDND